MRTYVFMADSYWFNQAVAAVHRSAESQWEDTEQGAAPDPLHGFLKSDKVLPLPHTHTRTQPRLVVQVSISQPTRSQQVLM